MVTRRYNHAVSMPTHREGCQTVPRPCPYVQCRHNNGPACYNGTNCTLDMADQGPWKERDVARLLVLTQAEVREALASGLEKMRDGLRKVKVGREDGSEA
jgi:hypothetical protein